MVNVLCVSKEVTIIQDESVTGGPLFAVHTGCGDEDGTSFHTPRFFYDGDKAWSCGYCGFGYQPTRGLDIANYYTFDKEDVTGWAGQVRYSLQQWVASWLGIEDYTKVEIVLD